MLDGELAANAGRDPVDEVGQLGRVAERDRDALESPITFDEDPVRGVDQDVRDPRVVEQWLQTTKTEQVGAEPLDLGIGQRDAGGGPHTLADEPPPRWIGVEGEERRGIEARGDLAPEPCDQLGVDHPSAWIDASIARCVGARVAKSSPARNGSRGIEASNGQGRRAAIRAASGASIPTTTSPTWTPPIG